MHNIKKISEMTPNFFLDSVMIYNAGFVSADESGITCFVRLAQIISSCLLEVESFSVSMVVLENYHCISVNQCFLKSL